MKLAKRKLLFVMYDRSNYPSGPVVNYLRLLPEFVKQGYSVHLLSIYHHDWPNTRILEAEGVVTYKHPYTYTEKLVKWILERVEEIQPDVFIADVSTPACFAGKWLIESGIPVINTHRSNDDLNWGKAIYFSSLTYNNVLTGIVCVNRGLETTLRSRIGQSPIRSTVIPSGVPIGDEVARQGQKGLKIVYAGRLIQKQKRVKEMFEVFVILAGRYADISFTIIGDGPERNACTEIVAHANLESQFDFKGQLLGSAYKSELAKHEVVVLLSDYEGTPGSVMDGMSCGLVPVCLKYNGIEELVRNEYNGLIVSDRQDSFYEAINYLLHNPDKREQYSANARRTIEEEFSINHTTKKWAEFFATVRLQVKKKEKFETPRSIILPNPHPLLLEYIVQKSLIQRLKEWIVYFRNNIFPSHG